MSGKYETIWNGRLPFPFITGAYVNHYSHKQTPQISSPCYHSLLSRVLMSTQKYSTRWGMMKNEVTIPFYHGCLCQQEVKKFERTLKNLLPFPFITGAYVNKIFLDKKIGINFDVTIPFYHGCLCQLMSAGHVDFAA